MGCRGPLRRHQFCPRRSGWARRARRSRAGRRLRTLPGASGWGHRGGGAAVPARAEGAQGPQDGQQRRRQEGQGLGGRRRAAAGSVPGRGLGHPLRRSEAGERDGTSMVHAGDICLNDLRRGTEPFAAGRHHPHRVGGGHLHEHHHLCRGAAGVHRRGGLACPACLLLRRGLPEDRSRRPHSAHCHQSSGRHNPGPGLRPECG
mmetsp:Transcript_87946/g.257107  ORF Transcript_87946/g.257107 Transcript_87946/m.257107 type:complete len:203 (-) Transcript_87946:340-948(-)